jgi:hypothetical protein
MLGFRIDPLILAFVVDWKAILFEHVAIQVYFSFPTELALSSSLHPILRKLIWAQPSTAFLPLYSHFLEQCPLYDFLQIQPLLCLYAHQLLQTNGMALLGLYLAFFPNDSLYTKRWNL